MPTRRHNRRPGGSSSALVSKKEHPLQKEWESLCRYLHACVLAASRSSGQPIYIDGPELLISGRKDYIDLKDLPIAKAEIYEYGWPVRVTSESGNLVSTPVFTILCEISEVDRSPSTSGSRIWRIKKASPIELNPNLTIKGVPLIIDGDYVPDLSTEQGRMLILKELEELTGESLKKRAHSTRHTREPGLHDLASLCRISNDDTATSGLLKELSRMATSTDWVDTAAGQLICPGAVSTPSTTKSKIPVSPLHLNHNQMRVLEKSQNQIITVVTGPPGTGKSQLAVAAAANAWVSNESVLVASTNNAAVQVAVDKATREVSPALLVRTGNKEARDNLPTLITNIVAKHSQKLPKEEATDLGEVIKTRTELDNFLKSVNILENSEVDVLDSVKNTRSAAALFMNPNTLESSFLDFQLLSIVYKILKFPLFRKMRLKFALSKQNIAVRENISVAGVKDWVAAVQIFANKRKYTENLQKTIGSFGPSVELLEKSYNDASLSYVSTYINNHVASNLGLASNLCAVSPTRLKNSITGSLPGLRGWGCTALSISFNFELKPSLFDLVILDEASQCPLAYVLPIAYRAKKLLVIGDPNQLPPVVSLSHHRSEVLASKWNTTEQIRKNPGLQYSSETSAFDAFQNIYGSKNTSVLAEHFRCHPKIARWFNEVFYGNQLKILTGIATSGKRGLDWEDIHGSCKKGADGRSWVNETEAQKAADLVEEALGYGYSIGVVSPFRAQASLIDRIVRRRISPEDLGEADFKSGTSHTFQGEERDMIIFSCCVADGISARALNWVETQRNLINVAASRAKTWLIVLGDPKTVEFGSETLSSLRSFSIASAGSAAAHRVDSEAELAILNALHRAGIAPQTKTDVEGFELDFSATICGHVINIEVDGDHHIALDGGRRRSDLTRDRVLENIGYSVLRYPAWRCWVEPDEVVKDILKRAQVSA